MVYAYSNSKVSIIEYVESDPQSGLEVNWVYTGCNTAYGDQRWSYDSSDDCIRTQKDGKIMFTAKNTAQYLIDGGDYEMWILYYNGHRLNDITGGVAATLTINPEPEYSKSPSSKSPSSRSPSTDE